MCCWTVDIPIIYMHRLYLQHSLPAAVLLRLQSTTLTLCHSVLLRLDLSNCNGFRYQISLAAIRTFFSVRHDPCSS